MASSRQARGVGFQVNFFTRPLLTELERRGARLDYVELLCDTISGSLEGPHEIEPKHQAWLDELISRYPVVAHSNFGEGYGFAPLDETPSAKRHIPIAKRIDAEWMADHLFYGTPSTSYMWSTPIQFSVEEVIRVADRARELQQRLGKPLLHENAFIYALFPGSNLSEPEFLTRVVERAETHLLLDLHNIHANDVNFDGFDCWSFVKNIPLDRVVEVHVAGGQWIEDWYHDLHNSEVPERVWELLQYVLESSSSVRGVTLEVQGPVHNPLSRPMDTSWVDMAERDLARIGDLWRQTHA